MKKWIVVALTLAVLLAACGTPAVTPTPAPAPVEPQPAEPTKAPEQPKPSEPTKAPEATKAPEPTLEPAEISFMMWGAPEELKVWQQIVDDFQAKNPNIKVNVDVSDWDSYWTKLKTLYAGGTPPDVFAMDAPLYPDWVSRGALLNLQKYIDASPGLLDGLYPNTLDVYKTPDGYFGLPRDFQTIVLFYNKDLFDAAKIPYPTDKWTLDDLRKTAKQLTKTVNGNKQWGFSTDLYDMELFWSENIWEHGGDIISADHAKTLIGEPKAREAWKLLSDMVTVDKSMPDYDEALQYGDPFQAGVAAMDTMGHWAVNDRLAAGLNMGVAPMPAGPDGRATSVNSAGFVVAKDSKYPDAAWEFIKYALSEEAQKKLAELGFAIPVLKSVAEGPSYLNPSAPIDQQVFLDALAYARTKPAFKGYEEWATVVGDGLLPVWAGEKMIDEALDEIVPGADAVLAKNK
jgi:multiple sugar transport system substrate-binding protein